jgi:hypothetical protein
LSINNESKKETFTKGQSGRAKSKGFSAWKDTSQGKAQTNAPWENWTIELTVHGLSLGAAS